MKTAIYAFSGDRGLTKEQIKTRMACQYHYGRKKMMIEQSILNHNHGTLLEIDNSYDQSAEYIYEKFEEITNETMS